MKNLTSAARALHDWRGGALDDWRDDMRGGARDDTHADKRGKQEASCTT